MIDQLLDMILNYRQSGHPAVRAPRCTLLVTTLLGGAMRWDIRHPEKRFGDRFVLVARAHDPAGLLHAGGAQRGAARQARADGRRALRDRRRGASARSTGRTCWASAAGAASRATPRWRARPSSSSSTPGPSGHGSPAAAGEALALKRAGAGGVRVFAFEGEGGLTPGASTRRRTPPGDWRWTTWSIVVDWNDFGIDDHPVSSVRARHAGGLVRLPRLARARHRARQRVGARSTHAPRRDGPRRTTRPRADRRLGEDPQGPRLPQVRQTPSHGAPHAAEQRAVLGDEAAPSPRSTASTSPNFGGPAPTDPADGAGRSSRRTCEAVIGGAAPRPGARRLPRRHGWSRSATACPSEIPAFRLGGAQGNPFEDPRLYDFRSYPADAVRRSRARSSANRAALGQVGRLGQRLRRQGIRPAAVPGRFGRPGRLDQHRRLRRGLRRLPRLRLVRARRNRRGRAAAAGDHRVRQRRHHGRHRDGQLRRATRERSSTASGAPARPTAPSPT